MSSEIQLLENVELRLAMAATDQAFETSLNSYLCPILLKLASTDPSVRAKVLSICQHINTRIKQNETMKLPTTNLVGLFATQKSPLLQNFCLVYLDFAFARVDQETAQSLIDKLIWGISSRPESQQSLLLNIIIPVLAEYKEKRHVNGQLPDVDPLGLGDHQPDLHFLLSQLGVFQLYAIPPAAFLFENAAKGINGLSLASGNMITNKGKAAWSRYINVPLTL
jgi:proteasome component ECM29